MGKKVSEIKHDHNNSFDQLLIDADRGALEEKLSPFMTRPAYAHTSMEQERIFPKSECERCGYFRRTEFWKKVCTYPWDDPEEYDEAIAKYLPCAKLRPKEGCHEED